MKYCEICGKSLGEDDKMFYYYIHCNKRQQGISDPRYSKKEKRKDGREMSRV